MKKINRFFACPMSGDRPDREACKTCPSHLVRGPSTNESRIFPIDTSFCQFEDLTKSQAGGR